MSANITVYHNWHTYQYYIRNIRGKWLVNRTAYDYDGYYCPGLSYTNQEVTEDEAHRIIDA